jgi:hypothetical protein
MRINANYHNTKTGGKNGKHGCVGEVGNIAAVSNLALQVYEPSCGPKFTIIPWALCHLGLKKFSLKPAFNLLTILNAVPMYHKVFKTFQLHDSDMARFTYLQQNKDKLLLVQKDLKSSLKKCGLQEHDLDV